MYFTNMEDHAHKKNFTSCASALRLLHVTSAVVVTSAAAAACDVVTHSKRLCLQKTGDVRHGAAGAGDAARAHAAAVALVLPIHAAQTRQFVPQHRRRAAAVRSVAVCPAISAALFNTAQVAAVMRRLVGQHAGSAGGHAVDVTASGALRRRAAF